MSLRPRRAVARENENCALAVHARVGFVTRRSEERHIAFDGDAAAEKIIGCNIGVRNFLLLSPCTAVAREKISRAVRCDAARCVIHRSDNRRVAADADAETEVIARYAVARLQDLLLRPRRTVSHKNVSLASRIRETA